MTPHETHTDHSPTRPTLGSLFSGYGGLDMAVNAVFGAETVWHSEIEKAPSKILAHHSPGIPNIGDITKVKWENVPPVEIICGGSPCQDVSQAGKRAGMTEGTRSNLWREMVTAIKTLHPRLVVWENVRGVLNAPAFSTSDLGPGEGLLDDRPNGHLRALGRVLGDLADLGFDAEWGMLRASDVGAPHHRARIFLLAWPSGESILNPRNYPRRTEYGFQFEKSPGGFRESGENTSNTQGYGRNVRSSKNEWQTDRKVNSPTNDCEVAANAEREGRGPGRNGSGDASSQGAPGDTERCSKSQINWGVYAPAVEQWEKLTRPAPFPVEIGPKGGRRLAAPFAEWMMGLPPGWVTDVPGVNRREQLKAIGNGVCPQQAMSAIFALVERVRGKGE